MRTYLGYITISLLVPVLFLFIFLSHQEWSLAQSPYHVLDERIPVESIELAQNSYMKAANGKVISEISTGEKRTCLKLEDPPFFLENPFIVTEDQKFYDHAGVDLSGINRALLINGALEQAEYEKLIKSTIKLDLSTPVDLYPDYVTYVHQELKNLVASSEGLDKSLQSTDVAIRKNAEAELDKKVKKLLNSGVTIHTALDTKLQTQSKTAVQSKIGVHDIE